MNSDPNLPKQSQTTTSAATADPISENQALAGWLALLTAVVGESRARAIILAAISQPEIENNHQFLNLN